MSNFQITILSVFGFFTVLAVLIFSGVIKLGSSSTTAALSGPLVIWGTIPATDMSALIGPINDQNKGLEISYVRKNPATFDMELVEALATGTGPDLFFLPTDAILKNKNKVFPIPYTSLTKQTFESTFVTQATLYLDESGVLALPFSLDPLVLYYNPGMFDAAGIAKVPEYWDEILVSAPRLTARNTSGAIARSAIAMGEYVNIPNAKDILAMLVMQPGGQFVARDQEGKYFSIMRQQVPGSVINPAEEALRFYTEFANPLKTAYSWNKSLPSAQDAFVSGTTAMYIGYASELFTIRERNPNLNFNVASVPQIRGAATKLTFGKMYGLAISKSSKNLATAASVAGIMTGKDASKIIMTALSLAPVRRDVIVDGLVDTDPPYMKVFYDAALVSRGWLDPDTTATDVIFRNMVTAALSGAQTPGSALSTANDELDFLLQKI
ncbi:MAG: extracellular solute-binding protein [Candidatus Pacebacteria bacterium]|jgi:ABC-type glycerol-3-phosphate transport system substrate-binding protein|nr:extracellular solute-binding protein [Candidatus Paceibacterota bacterium]